MTVKLSAVFVYLLLYNLHSFVILLRGWHYWCVRWRLPLLFQVSDCSPITDHDIRLHWISGGVMTG